MSQIQPDLFDLVERISRLAAMPGKSGGLTPREAAILRYLAQANQFSRGRGAIALYLGLGRAAINAALAGLRTRGLIRVVAAEKRRVPDICELTAEGEAMAAESPLVPIAAEALTPVEIAVLTEGLKKTLRAVLMRRGQRSFGICNTCSHHRTLGTGAWCALVKVDLAPREIEKICGEHAA